MFFTIKQTSFVRSAPLGGHQGYRRTPKGEAKLFRAGG